MSEFSFDLRTFRERMSISQTELATLLGAKWSPDKISKLEKNSNNISVKELWEIAEKTGVSLDEILKMEKMGLRGLQPVDNWTNVKALKEELLERIADVEADLSAKNQGSLKLLSQSVETMLRKPKVAFFGKSNAGKSTMINALLGLEKMATAWTTTTSITVYIKHIDDKPAYAAKENENYMKEECWIFQNEKDGSSWNELKLQDEKYCKELMIARGGTDVLCKYGTVLEGNKVNSLATSAVFFLDADILKTCDLIDLPGNSDANSNKKTKFNEMGERAKNLADIFVYLSAANVFMQEDDIVFLSNMIQLLENEMREKEETKSEDEGNLCVKDLLNRIFIVASQSQIIGNKKRKNTDTDEIELISAEDLRKEIIEEGCENLWMVLGKQDFEKFCTKEEIRNRFFTYSIDREDIRKEFETELSSILEKLPTIIKEESLKSIKANMEVRRNEAEQKVKKYEEILLQKEEYKKMLENAGEKLYRVTANIKRKNAIIEEIRNYKKYDLEKFREIYNEIVNKESIEKELKTIKKKTKNVQMLTTSITRRLDNKQQKLLENHSNALKKEIDEYLDNYVLFEKREDINVKVGFMGFNATNIFAGSLAGMSTIGGLSSWVAGMGNLGGYIALAKGVSLLSRLGIHLGGTAAVASAVSVIGGPVTIGIALATTVGIAGYTLLSSNWEAPLANRIVKAYENEAALEKYQHCIKKFWENTETAFIKANEDLERERESFINQLREFIDTNDDALIEKEIEDAQAIQDGLGHHLRKMRRMEQET